VHDQPQKPKYSRPPVQSRLLTVFGEHDHAKFDELIPSWADLVAADFPEQQIGKQWSVKLNEKNGIPRPRTELSLRYRCVASDEKRKLIRELTPVPGGISIRLERSAAAVHSFDELFAFAEKYLPLWRQHFGVSQVRGLRLNYKNVFSPEITPFAFEKLAGGRVLLKVDRWLTYFQSVPGKYQNVVRPIQSKLTVSVDPEREAEFTYLVKSSDSDEAATIVVHLVMDTFGTERKLDISGLLAETQWSHTLILEQFEAFFTKAALDNFR
jgi:hypothetical protein